jgi:hypothetical protein
MRVYFGCLGSSALHMQYLPLIFAFLPTSASPRDWKQRRVSSDGL